MDLVFAPLTRQDTPAWARLTDLIDRADGRGESYDAEDLAEELAEDGVDPLRDTWALHDGDQIIAFGQVRVRPAALDGRAVALLEGGVHPGRRGRGIGRALMDRMEHRARQLAAERHPGLPVTLRNPGGQESDPARRLLAHRGYDISRYFTLMRRDLPPVASSGAGPVGAGRGPGVATLEGYRITAFEPALSARTLRARNAAFADHWGATATSAAGWEDLVTARSFTPDCSSVALAPPTAPPTAPPKNQTATDQQATDRQANAPETDAAEVASFCLAQDWQDGPLYLALIGTVPGERGRGLARACLEASLAAGALAVDAAGNPRFNGVELHVDADSPTGAMGLYEAAGFTPVVTHATFTRTDPPLTA